MIHVNRQRKVRALLAACALCACQSFAHAGATSATSTTVKWSFDPGVGGGVGVKAVNVNPPPANSGMPVPPTYQLSQTYTAGSSSSVAKGSVGYIANASQAGFSLAAGTGITQSDPNNARLPNPSQLRLDFDGLFTASSPSFGPTATAYTSIAVAGNVGAGGSAQFIESIQFLDAVTGVALTNTASFDQTFAPGAFNRTFTFSQVMNPTTLANGRQFRVKGFIKFLASNTFAPTSIAPFDIEFGAAPPTATFYADSDGSWNDPTNWTPPPGSVIDDQGDGDEGEPTILFGSSPVVNNNTKVNPAAASIPLIPNGIGQRARFANYITGDRTIHLDSNITLGVLDVNTPGDLMFDTGNNSGFILDTLGGNAALVTHNQNGNRHTDIDVKVTLNKTLDLITDGSNVPGGADANSIAGVTFEKQILGNYGAGINKQGKGKANLNAANNFTGGTNVEEGDLDANVPGSLGNGSVHAKGGRLNYNAAHAAAQGISVHADELGEIHLGIVPDSDERFLIGNHGIIAGASEALEGLTNDSEFGNLSLSPGAIIGHESFDKKLDKGNPAGLGSTPQYIFGISADFTDNHPPLRITVGSASNSVWSGFGSDGRDRTFGSKDEGAKDRIRVKGTAELFSPDGTLYLNARLVSKDETSVLNKTGPGTVVLKNNRNKFRGEVNIVEGLLLVDGVLADLTCLNVLPGGELGGKGQIVGPVCVSDGGIVSPGSNDPQHRAGVLHVDSLALENSSILNFDLDSVIDTSDNGNHNGNDKDKDDKGKGGKKGDKNVLLDELHRPPTDHVTTLGDVIDVRGNLVLDGILNIFDLGNFGPGTYTLFTAGGITDDGLQLGSLPSDLFSYAISVTSDKVLLDVTPLPNPTLALGVDAVALAVPEPASAMLLALFGSLGAMGSRRRGRQSR